MPSVFNAVTRRPKRKDRRKKSRGKLRMETLEKRNLMAAAINDGGWHEASTWDTNQVPGLDDEVLISQGVTVQLDQDEHQAKNIVVHGNLVATEDTNFPNKSLTADWIHVNSHGELIAGSKEDRYDEGTFTINLIGTDVRADRMVPMAMGHGHGMGPGMMMEINNNDGFLMTGGGGRVQFYGAEKLSFTKLAQSVDSGSNQIIVESVIERNFSHGNSNDNGFETSATDDGAVNWTAGDEIVIASSSYDYRKEDVRRITGVQHNTEEGTVTLTLDQSLDYDHYGEVETYGTNSHPWNKTSVTNLRN